MKKKHDINYLSGEKILVGDIVKCGDCTGKIVFVISSDQYCNEYPKENWSYLNEGFGIDTEKYGLVHQIDPDEDLILINLDGK